MLSKITYTITMRLVCISDTHGLESLLPPLPEGDVLVVAGDFTGNGSSQDIRFFSQWLKKQTFKHKVVIAGNHDTLFEYDPFTARAMLKNCTYLEDSGVTIKGIHFYGTPWQPVFMDWAFNLPKGESLQEKWDMIPQNTDVLITHCPPFGILDISHFSNTHAGDEDLLQREKDIKPKVHIFGHIHEGYGQTKQDGAVFINASICDETNTIKNSPIIVDL